MNAKHGLDFIRDSNWNPKNFTSINQIINYAVRNMPKELKELGFGVSTWVGNDYVRFSYGRKY